MVKKTLLQAAHLHVEYQKKSKPCQKASQKWNQSVMYWVFCICFFAFMVAGIVTVTINWYYLWWPIWSFFSGIELFQRFLGQSHTDSGLSVLRTFRLLRILKLVRFMPNLRRQLFVMLRTMDNVAVFFSLLILFIFIFR